MVAGATLGGGLRQGHDDPRARRAWSSTTCSCPGMAKGLLPSTTIQHNPAERAKSMDFELRGDAAMLPRYDGVLKQFKEDAASAGGVRGAPDRLRRVDARPQATLPHRCALVRREHQARRKAGSSCESWPSGCSRRRSTPTWDPGADIDEETNPILGYRERFVRDWPEPALPDDSGRLFAEGWRHAALDRVRRSAACSQTLLEPLGLKERRDVRGTRAPSGGITRGSC